jgi:hypothetical protein
MRNLIFLILFLIFIIAISLPATAGTWGNVNLTYEVPGGIRCNTTSIIKTIQQGQTVIEPIEVWESNSTFPSTYLANFSASGTVGSWITFDPNTVLVPLSPTRNYTTAIISVPSSQPVSIYTGNIFVNSTPPGTSNCSIGLLVSVTSVPTPPITPAITGGGGGGQQIILDTELHIEPGSGQVVSGQRVYATITITKAGGTGPVNTNVSYIIRDPTGKTVDYRSTTVGVDNIRRDIYYLTVPPSSPLGVYTFRVFVTYGTLEDTSMDTFQVVRNLPSTVLNLKNIGVPLMFTDQKGTITLELENIEDNQLDTNSTFYFPEGFEPKIVSVEQIIESKSGELIRAETIPQVFGLFKGFVSIKYDGRGLTREFSILVLPSYILLIPLIGIVIFVVFLLRKKKEKRYMGTERISRIRRSIGR